LIEKLELTTLIDRRERKRRYDRSLQIVNWKRTDWLQAVLIIEFILRCSAPSKS